MRVLSVLALVGAASAMNGVSFTFAADPQTDFAMSTILEGPLAVSTYDVVLDVERRFLLKTVEEPVADGFDDSQLIWTAWKSGEVPMVQCFRYRQLAAPEGRRRVDSLNADGLIRSTVAFNGELDRRSSIRCAQDGHDYATYLWTAYGRYSLADLVRDRKGSLRIEKNGDSIMLECPPVEGASLGSLCFRIWCDVGHGHMPNQIDLYVKSFDRLQSRKRVTEFREVGTGICVPTKMIYSEFNAVPGMPHFGEPTSVTTLTVDVSKSAWNRPIDADVFSNAARPGK